MEKGTNNRPEKIITWQNFKNPGQGRGRFARENIMDTEGGPVGPAADARTPRECFEIFFPPEMLTKLTKCTNIHIASFLVTSL